MPGLKQHPALTDWLFSFWHWPSPETTEWFCLRSALWWVIQLAPCLTLSITSPVPKIVFTGLAHLGPYWCWQMLIGGLLLAQVAGVCLGRVWLRVATLTLFSAVWAFFTGMFWADTPHLYGLPRNTGIGIYASLAYASLALAYASLAADCMIVAIHLVKLWWIDHLSRRCKEAVLCPSPSS